MTKFEVGDTVRLTREGRVDDINPSQICVDAVWQPTSWFEVELVKRKPKVGDTVAHLELDGLPVGTVIVSKGGRDGALIKRPDGRWFNGQQNQDFGSGGLSVAREIIYLPD